MTAAQSSYVRWQTTQYAADGSVASQRVYHTIPVSGQGAAGSHYDQTTFGYDRMGRPNRQVTPGGTITRTVYDARGNVTESWTGTDDAGATDADPSGGGAAGNNLVLVSRSEYDGGGRRRQQPDEADRLCGRPHDAGDQLPLRLGATGRTATDGEEEFYERYCHDNLDRVADRPPRHHGGGHPGGAQRDAVRRPRAGLPERPLRGGPGHRRRGECAH
ncbi:MAG: hypothetical protein U0736_20675 [Gemmataceae bacterium]